MAEKMSKEKAGYREATGMKRCANCSMFRRRYWTKDEGSCSLVAGDIKRGDTCDYWEPKKNG